MEWHQAHKVVGAHDLLKTEDRRFLYLWRHSIERNVCAYAGIPACSTAKCSGASAKRRFSGHAVRLHTYAEDFEEPATICRMMQLSSVAGEEAFRKDY